MAESIPVPVRRRGQVTLPAKTRKKLEIEEGDYVLISVKTLEESI